MDLGKLVPLQFVQKGRVDRELVIAELVTQAGHSRVGRIFHAGCVSQVLVVALWGIAMEEQVDLTAQIPTGCHKGRSRRLNSQQSTARVGICVSWSFKEDCCT